MDIIMKEFSALAKKPEEIPLFWQIMNAATVGEILDLDIKPEDIVPLFYISIREITSAQTFGTQVHSIAENLAACPATALGRRRVFI